MTNISTKRFNVKSDGFGGYIVRDRDAPCHSHSVAASELPAFEQMAQMTESQFDSAIVAAIYGESD